MESLLRRWRTTVAAAAVTLIGALVLTAQISELSSGERELSALRDHGQRVRARATLTTSCTEARQEIDCTTSSVRLDFTDRSGVPVSAREKTIDGSLYVPQGHRDGAGRVPTTVVYDRADPYRAQAAGALDQGVLDLASHHWIAWTVGLVLLGGGVTGGVAAWPERAERRP
ncbi:hypothetical protein VT50_0218870 [Streptomyces antioxidans]|uniref:DUF3592 domain-containing protein n=1 Tax=Streptomyces antioxidans TaxID=1507734 RepID=A0A1V4D339_9ACTN|nr:DUF3592 domain-containing protein [Streptomyces antioxidans]OPF78482.1 hypothetical protein VT50_0218870 [Streptomyces antioxidans]